ncbi:MAG: adenylate/guanylate cyclase domain-containing protein [Elusimicrobiota bacterium]
MSQKKLSEKAEKELKSIYHIYFFLLTLYSVNESFSNFFLITFSKVLNLSKQNISFLIDNTKGVLWGSFFIMFLAVYYWTSDFKKYIKKPSDDLKLKIRKKIENIYFYFIYFYAVSFFTALLFSYLRFKYENISFWKTLAPAITFSFLTQFGFILPYVDATLYKLDSLMAELYDKEELYRPRSGKSFPVFYKLLFLVISCAVMPIIMTVLAIETNVDLPSYKGEMAFSFLLFIIFLSVGINSIFYGLHKPLEILSDKMKKAAGGDYSAKTRIYFSDEIGRIKAAFNTMLDGLREREELFGTFGRYLSPEVAKELIKNKKLSLGGEEIKAAVMFCDIRDFTPLSERMSPSQLVSFLNDYLSKVVPPIMEKNGVISKFMGDGIMAIFAPSLGCQEYAKKSLTAALEMRNALAIFNNSGKYPFKISFGIGLHAGNLVAGNIGAQERMEYAFIGDTVNAASRIESKTKDFSCDILVSEELLKVLGEDVKKFNLISAGEVKLKGKSMPLSVYKLS